MLTIKLPYRTSEQDIIDEYIYQYSGLFYKVYNNPELMVDTTFIKELLNDYIDKSIYDFCVADVKTKLNQLETLTKKKKKEISDIEKELVENNFKSKKDKRRKYYLNKKLNELKRTLNKNICFGGKSLLRNITKTHNSIKNIKAFDSTNTQLIKEKEELLLKYKKQFTENRKLGIYFVGRAVEHGNRKIKFDFVNNRLIFKPNKRTQVELFIKPKKNVSVVLNKIQELVDIKSIAVTVRIDNKHIYISYDEELLNGYSFDEQSCKKKQQQFISKESRKNVFKKYIKKQEEKKLKNKVVNRYLAVDLNPHNIGLSIIDKTNDGGEYNVVLKQNIDLSKLSSKLYKSSSSIKQLKQNNKRKHEIREVWKYVFKLAVHYKVAHFVMEDLNFKSKTLNDNSKEFNRKTKNIWHRTLTTNLITKHCNINGIIKIEVNPCYSSFIGNMIHDDYDPIASSLEIGRRGIVKYIKSSSIYPDITRINQEKLNYLLGENMDVKDMTWNRLYCKLSSLRYRNLSQNKLIDKNLYSKKSKIKIYS